MNEATLSRISVVTLGVADLERAERFYMDGLGLQHAGPPKGIIYFELEGARLALFPATISPATRESSPRHPEASPARRSPATSRHARRSTRSPLAPRRRGRRWSGRRRP